MEHRQGIFLTESFTTTSAKPVGQEYQPASSAQREVAEFLFSQVFYNSDIKLWQNKHWGYGLYRISQACQPKNMRHG